MRKMKKWLAGAAVTAAVLLSGVSVFAAGPGNCGANRGMNYVDANGDGICDNFGTNRGNNYVDADGDGICDNLGSGGLRPQDGTGRQLGRRR